MSKEIEVDNWLDVQGFAEKHGLAVQLRGSILDSEGHEVGYVDMRSSEEEHYRIVVEEEDTLSPEGQAPEAESAMEEEETEEEIPEEPSFDPGEGLSSS